MAETDELTFDKFQRWRLLLGKGVNEQLAGMRQASGAGAGGGGCLSAEMGEMDEALAAIYDRDPGEGDGKRGAGLGASAPRLARWLGDVRKYFERDVVVVIQQDAIERKGLKQLLFEPETLAQIAPSVELVGTLLSLKNMIPDQTKETARRVVSAVVEDIKKLLSAAIERAVRGALDRSTHQPVPSLPNLDWKKTVRANLKNYQRDRKTIIPDQFFFHARQRRRREWNVIVCMDQSGSMAESVVYASVMGAIFASIPALETHVVAFDTEVVDLTDECDDPIELLFGVQLGGGTDINRAVAYCQGLVHDPRKTLFLLITDLYEGGNETQLVKRLDDMTQSGVRSICMLALSDSGVPSYDERLAARLANVGVPCLGCTPNVLPRVLEGMLKGRNLRDIAATYDTRNAKKLAAFGPRPAPWRLCGRREAAGYFEAGGNAASTPASPRSVASERGVNVPPGLFVCPAAGRFFGGAAKPHRLGDPVFRGKGQRGARPARPHARAKLEGPRARPARGRTLRGRRASFAPPDAPPAACPRRAVARSRGRATARGATSARRAVDPCKVRRAFITTAVRRRKAARRRAPPGAARAISCAGPAHGFASPAARGGAAARGVSRGRRPDRARLRFFARKTARRASRAASGRARPSRGGAPGTSVASLRCRDGHDVRGARFDTARPRRRANAV